MQRLFDGYSICTCAYVDSSREQSEGSSDELLAILVLEYDSDSVGGTVPRFSGQKLQRASRGTTNPHTIAVVHAKAKPRVSCNETDESGFG